MAENNGDKPGQEFMTIEVPEFAFTINPDPEGNPVFVGLDVRGSAFHSEFFLCRPEPAEVERVSRVFGRELLRVATTLKRSAKGLIVAKGVDSRGLRQEGR